MAAVAVRVAVVRDHPWAAAVARGPVRQSPGRACRDHQAHVPFRGRRWGVSRLNGRHPGRLEIALRWAGRRDPLDRPAVFRGVRVCDRRPVQRRVPLPVRRPRVPPRDPARVPRLPVVHRHDPEPPPGPALDLPVPAWATSAVGLAAVAVVRGWVTFPAGPAAIVLRPYRHALARAVVPQSPDVRAVAAAADPG